MCLHISHSYLDYCKFDLRSYKVTWTSCANLTLRYVWCVVQRVSQDVPSVQLTEQAIAMVFSTVLLPLTQPSIASPSNALVSTADM